MAQVRVTHLTKGQRFTYKGRFYTMSNNVPKKDRHTKATFRWVGCKGERLMTNSQGVR
jgi:hypothetical protein